MLGLRLLCRVAFLGFTLRLTVVGASGHESVTLCRSTLTLCCSPYPLDCACQVNAGFGELQQIPLFVSELIKSIYFQKLGSLETS